MAMVATFDSRRPTTVVRHSTTDSRLSSVERRLVVGRRMSNVVLWKDPATTQEDAVKNAVKPSGDAVKNAVKEFDAGLRENIIEKCAELYCFLRIDPRRTILTAVESLGFSPRSVAQYLNVLKDANVLEHVGPTNGGTWKFLI